MDKKEKSENEFWECLDKGEFKKCHQILDENDFEITEKSTMRIAVLFRELKYQEAYDFSIIPENKCSNYIKGLAAFYHPRDTKKENFLKYIKSAIDNLQSAMNNDEIGFYNTVVAQTMLIDSYLEINDKEKSFSIAKEIINDYSDMEDISPILNGKYQIYLIDAFNPKNEKNRKQKLKMYFELSKYERHKTFEDIIYYSRFLKYKPDDLIEAFSETSFSSEDGYFNWLLEDALDEKESKQLNIIWFWQYLILSQLLITDKSKIEEISHYTSQATFDLLLKEKKKIAEFSLANANDKIEGNVLTEILLDNNCIDKTVNTENTNNFIAVQTSYSRNKNSLTMFRLYGKKDDEEGTGISLVFDRNFFQTIPVRINNNKDINKGSIIFIEDERKPLFWILYYNSERKLLYFYPSEDELKPYEIDLSINTQLKWNTYSSYKDKTEMKQRNILYSFKRLLKAVKDSNNKELAVKVLYKLRYFIKSSDFAEEKELRMLDLCNPSDLEEVNYKLYKEYLEILKYDSLKEVVVGPKVKNKTGYSEYIRKNLGNEHEDILVIPSNAPLA